MAGKRLTCPVCRDSMWATNEEIAEAGGKIQCANHWVGVEMVDLAMLMEILGGPAPEVLPVEEVDFEKEDMNVLHPDDFEFADWG